MSPTHSGRNGLAFSYLDEGTGNPFVFQHGRGGDAAQPRSLWSGAGRLVCLECRGHGRTTPLGPPNDLLFGTFARDRVFARRARARRRRLASVTVKGEPIKAGDTFTAALASVADALARGLVVPAPANGRRRRPKS